MESLICLTAVTVEGRFVGIPIEVDWVEDQEAIRKAKQAADGHDIELWDGSRLASDSEKG